MSSYILKNSDEDKKVLLYQEKSSYTFTPKKIRKVKSITVLDKTMLTSILGEKVITSYNRLLQIIYALISSEDTTSGDVLVAYSEIERIRNYLLSIAEKIEKEFVDYYLKKLYVLELELKKVHVMELTEEIEEERGISR